MNQADILTPRLRLATLTLDRIDADATGDYARLGQLLAATVPPQWPPEHWEPHVFDFFRRQYAEHPHSIGWSRYVITNQTSTLIGTLGGFPKTTSEVEVGYGILPPWQRQGYASEGLSRLLVALFREPGIVSATAQTFPHLAGSLGVLRKAGFQPAGQGDEPGAIRFRLDRECLPPVSPP